MKVLVATAFFVWSLILLVCIKLTLKTPTRLSHLGFFCRDIPRSQIMSGLRGELGAELEQLWTCTEGYFWAPGELWSRNIGFAIRHELIEALDMS